MKRLIVALIPLLSISQLLPADEPIRERIEWADIWVTDADKDDLPRVLLIGDSITRGYFGEVEKRLAGKAYCARLTTSKCVSDPWFPDEVRDPPLGGRVEPGRVCCVVGYERQHQHGRKCQTTDSSDFADAPAELVVHCRRRRGHDSSVP